MSYRLIALPFLSLPLLSHAATDLQTMVVTATKIPTHINQLGSSVTVITASDIERRQFQTLNDALQDIAGLNSVQLGVKGSQTSVFMRGSNSDHTLIIVDGIEMNDPSSPNGAFDFANFLLEDIASIEVVRGSQSVLYGADAIGGVIHIRSKNGQGNLVAKAKLEAGINSSHHESLAVSGSTGPLSYSLAAGQLKTDGDSIATEKRLAPDSFIDNDGYDNKVFSAKLGWQADEHLTVNLTTRYIETETDIDGGFDFSGNTVEDADATNDSKQLYLGAEFKGNYIDSQWQPTLTITKSDIERNNRNQRQSPFDTLDHTDFDGEKTKLGLQNDLYFIDDHIITVGFEYEDEKMDSTGFTDFGGFIIDQLTDAERQTRSLYLQDHIAFNDQFFATLGVRYDKPDDFDSEVTYRATTSYQLSDSSRLRAAYGTGFKAPSLFQLFGHTPNNFASEYRGNPDLNPETSKGWEIGLTQSLWQHRITADLTYFDSDIDDLITTVFLPSFDSTTMNQDSVEIHGVETNINIAATTNIDLSLNYTFTRTEDEDNSELLRRPKHKTSIDIDYRATNKMTLSGSLLHIGSRKDVDGFGSRVKMGGYSTINLAANYNVNPTTRIFTRLDNFTNNEYEAAYGFQSLGLAAYIGLEIKSQ